MSNEAHDRRMDYIEFGATDIAETQRFYGEVFGWTFESYGPEYIAFDDGRLKGGFTTERPVGKGAGGALVVVYCADLEGALARVTTAGGKVVQEIYSFPGGRRFHFEDPSGNELAVWSEERV